MDVLSSDLAGAFRCSQGYNNQERNSLAHEVQKNILQLDATDSPGKASITNTVGNHAPFSPQSPKDSMES